MQIRHPNTEKAAWLWFEMDSGGLQFQYLTPMKAPTENLCTTPLEIGKTYLDIWGERHKIEGHVVTGQRWGREPAPVDVSRVYCASCHYDIKTGMCGDPTCRLVNLPAANELAFWKRRIAEIESVNSADKLKLVKDGLDNMRARIAELTVA